jgi:hypothetical protein
MLTNILCRRLDRRLQGLADKLGFTYTRYADDLTFSATPEAGEQVGRLLRQVHHVLRDEGFTPHPDKQRVMRASSRQEVTGIVVNEKPSVSRTERRRLRAALHTARHKGLEAATWHGQPATRDTLVGYARFVQMVDARQGAALLPRALTLPGATTGHATFGERFRRQAAKGEAPALARGTWWQPAEAVAPVLALTAGQMKAARQERLNAERAARRAAAQAEAPRTSRVQAAATDAVEGDGEEVKPGQPRIGWWSLAIQFFIVVKLAADQKSVLTFMLGISWLVFSLVTRKTGWWRFVFAMMCIAAIVAGLK